MPITVEKWGVPVTMRRSPKERKAHVIHDAGASLAAQTLSKAPPEPAKATQPVYGYCPRPARSRSAGAVYGAARTYGFHNPGTARAKELIPTDEQGKVKKRPLGLSRQGRVIEGG
jgi:hypothetical protein